LLLVGGWFELRKVKAIELLLDQAFPFRTQEGQVVQRAVGWGYRDGIGLDVWMDGGDDLVRLGELQEGLVEPDLDAGEVKGVIAELDRLAAEIGWDAVAIATEREGAGLGDLARLAAEKSLT
jgi:hypothetical protein